MFVVVQSAPRVRRTLFQFHDPQLLVVSPSNRQQPSEESAASGVARRKNGLFAGNEGGGRTAAILYSMVQTCKAIGVDPRQYLGGVLIRLKQDGEPRELTPHAWKDRYAEELVQDRAWVLAKLRAELEEPAE